MKIEMIEKEYKKEEVKYPYLGKGYNKIVMFTAPKTGMCIASTSKIEIGAYLQAKDFNSWAEEDFRKFEGKIILEND